LLRKKPNAGLLDQKIFGLINQFVAGRFYLTVRQIAGDNLFASAGF
jgi:hypothetical protein